MRISVNQEANIENSTIVYACGYKNSIEYEVGLTNNLRHQSVKRILINWSPAHDICLLAAGKIEASSVTASELYDYAAGKIIALEAGAKITASMVIRISVTRITLLF